jgi:hypothetical protein
LDDDTDDSPDRFERNVSDSAELHYSTDDMPRLQPEANNLPGKTGPQRHLSREPDALDKQNDPQHKPESDNDNVGLDISSRLAPSKLKSDEVDSDLRQLVDNDNARNDLDGSGLHRGPLVKRWSWFPKNSDDDSEPDDAVDAKDISVERPKREVHEDGVHVDNNVVTGGSDTNQVGIDSVTSNDQKSSSDTQVHDDADDSTDRYERNVSDSTEFHDDTEDTLDRYRRNIGEEGEEFDERGDTDDTLDRYKRNVDEEGEEFDEHDDMDDTLDRYERNVGGKDKDFENVMFGEYDHKADDGDTSKSKAVEKKPEAKSADHAAMAVDAHKSPTKRFVNQEATNAANHQTKSNIIN